MERTVSIKMPEDVFQKLQYVASNSQRTIDDVIVKTVNAAFTAPTNIPAVLAEELAGMRQTKDETLWDALHPSMSAEQQQRLQELNEIADERSLMSSELDEREALLFAYHRSILRRAQAMAILNLRGYNISDELLQQTVR